jgi:hypothetical protein
VLSLSSRCTSGPGRSFSSGGGGGGGGGGPRAHRLGRPSSTNELISSEPKVLRTCIPQQSDGQTSSGLRVQLGVC